MSDSKTEVEPVWLVQLLSDDRKVVASERVRALAWGKARECVAALPEWPDDPLDVRIRCTPAPRE